MTVNGGAFFEGDGMEDPYIITPEDLQKIYAPDYSTGALPEHFRVNCAVVINRVLGKKLTKRLVARNGKAFDTNAGENATEEWFCFSRPIEKDKPKCDHQRGYFKLVTVDPIGNNPRYNSVREECPKCGESLQAKS